MLAPGPAGSITSLEGDDADQHGPPVADPWRGFRGQGWRDDIDALTPSTITAHAPGYTDRDTELVVGLQTDAPLKRAIMPTAAGASSRTA